MAIEFYCSQCGAWLSCTEDRAGFIAECPVCSGEITIPETQPVVAEEIAAREPVSEADLEATEPFADVSTPPSDDLQGEGGGPCPYCEEEYAAGAPACLHCGAQFEPVVDVPRSQPVSGLAIGALVLGILSILTACIVWVSVPLSLLAIALAICALKQGGRNPVQGRGLAVAGLVCGAVPLLLYLLLFLLIVGWAAIMMM